jgi:pyruvate dehydrogenase E1 component
MMERRKALGGSIPKRSTRARRPISMPSDKPFEEMRGGSGTQEVSTTMGFTRLLRNLCRDEAIGARIVPIIPDEARTFGMDALFRELHIYASQGQKYESVDHDLLLSYSESKKGQILEEGITEAGSLSSFIAAGTSYATRGIPMVPVLTFYSMFGFQRVGDLIWQAADSRARGFLLGATAGRTTLNGEGLQHQDGHSLVLASTVPACQAYDPAFAYEVGAIVQAGLERMYGADTPDEDRDVFYYITLYNENYVMPPVAADPAIADGIVRGLYRWAPGPPELARRATILFSGSAQGVAREAAADLAEHYGVSVELWSATSYKCLREEALAVERWNRLHPTEERRVPIVTQLLDTSAGPITAVTDFMKAVPDQIARFVPTGRPFHILGTDGMGRSDTREALRRHFEIDAGHIVVATLTGLMEVGDVDVAAVSDAIARYDIDPEAVDPIMA